MSEVPVVRSSASSLVLIRMKFSIWTGRNEVLIQDSRPSVAMGVKPMSEYLEPTGGSKGMTRSDQSPPITTCLFPTGITSTCDRRSRGETRQRIPACQFIVCSLQRGTPVADLEVLSRLRSLQDCGSSLDQFSPEPHFSTRPRPILSEQYVEPSQLAALP